MQKQTLNRGIGALLVVLALVLLWIVPAMAEQQKADEAIKKVYICGCGPACGCDMMAEKAGNCACGKDLIEKQVLKEDADKVYVCACPDGCKCKADPANPGKCACGKDLRAYPKKKPEYGCAHGMQPGGGGCDKPCCVKQPEEKK